MTLGEYLGAGSATTIGLWHLNGSSADNSGNGNNGTDTAITYGAAYGKFGQGARFNGSSSKISVPQAISLGTGVRTFVFWLSTTSNVPDGPGLISYTTSSSGTDQCTIRILGSDTGVGYVGKLRVFLRGAAGENVYRDSGIVLNDGVERAIIVTIDIANHAINIYVNGIANQSAQTGTTLSAIDTTGTVYFGADMLGTGYFACNLDEIIIENVVWSATQVKKYYTNAKGRFGIY